MLSVTGSIAGAALLVAAVVIVIVFQLRSERASRARALERIGFAVMAVFAVVAGLFIAGEAFGDPGGGAAVLLVLAWLIPLLGLSALSWFQTRRSTVVLVGLSAAVVVGCVWFAVDPQAWHTVENQHGPIRAVAVFVVGAALAVLGLKRTALAGWLLLGLGLVPITVSTLGSPAGAVSLSVVSVVPVITGTLYLISAHMTRNPPHRT
jgi:hypothetical protein